MIKTMLIAGMHDDDNQYVRYCNDLMLEVEHMAEVRNSHVPKKDAAIICGAQASHQLFNAVRQAYQGKLIFLSKKGISDIREQVEEIILGPDRTIMRGNYTKGNLEDLPLSTRFWWALTIRKVPGENVKIKDFLTFMDKFVVPGKKTTFEQAWYDARDEKFLLDSGRGSAIFCGIPQKAYDSMQKFGIKCDKSLVRPPHICSLPPTERRITKIIATPTKETSSTSPTKETSSTSPTKETSYTKETDMEASTELLLESMSQLQTEVRSLKDIMQSEMRGISTLVNSLIPKLNGLSTDQLQKVDQMIDLFLSMRS